MTDIEDKISEELLSISSRIDCLVEYAKKRGVGQRLLNNLNKISLLMSKINESLTSGMNLVTLGVIFKKALRLHYIGGFATVKDARLIASELYNISKEDFDSFLKGLIVNRPDLIEIGQGMSEGLGLEDCIELPNLQGCVYYFTLKKSAC